MTGRARGRSFRWAVALLLPLATACAPADDEGDVLPGHSRSVLEHDWPHPGELDFVDSGFAPARPDSVRITTTSGMRAYVLAEAGDPIVEVVAAIPLGRHHEREGEAGAAEAAAGVLRGALADHLGSELVASTDVHQEGGVTRLAVEVLAEDWHPALAALVSTLREGPAAASGFGGSTTGGATVPGTGRAGALATLTSLVADDPIGPPEAGLPVRPASVRSLLAEALRPDAVVLAIGGGVDRAEAESALEELTGGWASDAGMDETRSPTPAREARPPTSAAGRQPAEPLHAFDVPGFMSWIALGHAMEAIAPEDEAAMAVLEEVVNIRLNIATREIRGLTNRAMLLLPAATDGAGLLYLRTSGRSESVGPLIRYSMEELTRIRREEGAPSVEELAQAKGGLARGWWQDSLDGARRTAETYATETVRRGSLDHLLGWPDRVRAVTADEVTAAASRYIRPAAMTAVVLGQMDEVRTARHPRWPTALDEVPALLRPTGSGP